MTIQRSLTWWGIPSTRMFCGLITPVTHTHTCIRGRAPFIWGLYPDTIVHVVSKLQLFGFNWRECIDTFQSDLGAMNQVGKSSQRRHITLRGNIVPIDCFCYRALFLCCNPFHALMTPFHNAIIREDMRTTKMHSNLPIHLENPWRACCEMLCCYQLACHAHRIGLLSGWWYLLHLVTSNDAKWKTV